MASRRMMRHLRSAVRSGGGSPSSSDLPVSYGCSEEEDWVFEGDQGEPFGSLPTQQEVQEATSDLQDALTQVVNPLSSSNGYEIGSSSNTVKQSVDLLERPTSLESEQTTEENAIGRVEPVPCVINTGVAQQLGHNDVFCAFQLLQTNATLQEMVISLASDKSIWDAVLKNEKVREFRQSIHRGNSELHEKIQDSEPNVIIWATKGAKTKLMDYMEKITEIARVIFGFVRKIMFGEKDEDTLNKTLKYSLFLSIVVLLVIIVKRTFKMVYTSI